MTEAPNKIIPNSFQTPNFFVDECMSLLTGNEFKCLSFLARKTFGWQKRSDRISKSQIIAATGLANETVDKTMNTLVGFGLVLRISENNPQNTGTEWALQTDDSLVRFDILEDRQEKAASAQRQKTEKGRQKLAEKRGGLLDNPPSDGVSVEQTAVKGGIVEQFGGEIVQQSGGRSVGQSPQKPIKTKENMGANAPAFSAEEAPNKSTSRKRDKSTPAPEKPLEERIADFPADCQTAAELMLDVFNVKPPEKPGPGEKGGDYALWVNGLRALLKVAREYGVPFEKAMRLTYERWRNQPFDVAHPGALKKSMTSLLAQYSRNLRPEEAPEAPDTAPTEPGTVPSPELRSRMQEILARRKSKK